MSGHGRIWNPPLRKGVCRIVLLRQTALCGICPHEKVYADTGPRAFPRCRRVRVVGDADPYRRRGGSRIRPRRSALVNKKLSNEKFVGSAPESVVAKEKEKQVAYQEQYDSVKERINALDNLK